MRGSPHVHGVLWLSNAIDVKLLEAKFSEMKQSLIDYFDKLISCETPNSNYVDVGDHPCSKKICDVSDSEDDLAALFIVCKFTYVLRSALMMGKIDDICTSRATCVGSVV